MYQICGGDFADKMHLLMDFTSRPGEVADPWYTGDFDATWRDVIEGCQGLLDDLLNSPWAALAQGLRLSKNLYNEKGRPPYPYQSAKSRDLCVAFCTSQGASVRQRRAYSPLQKLEKVA